MMMMMIIMKMMHTGPVHRTKETCFKQKMKRLKKKIS